MKNLNSFISPAVKDLLRQVGNTAIHAAVFSYVGKKVANYVDGKAAVEADRKRIKE